MNSRVVAGVVGAAGLIVQIGIGLELANSGNVNGSQLLLPHMLIGVSGIILVGFISSNVFFAPSRDIVKLVYIIALLLTFAQVLLGFRILAIPDDMLAMTHMGIGVAILVVLALGGIMGAKMKPRQMMSGTTATA